MRGKLATGAAKCHHVRERSEVLPLARERRDTNHKYNIDSKQFLLVQTSKEFEIRNVFVVY